MARKTRKKKPVPSSEYERLIIRTVKAIFAFFKVREYPGTFDKITESMLTIMVARVGERAFDLGLREGRKSASK